MRSLVITTLLVCTTIFVKAQNDFQIGFTAAYNASSLLFKMETSNKSAFYLRGGYQFRFFEGVATTSWWEEDFTSANFRAPFASYGPLAEAGIIKSTSKNRALWLGFEYRRLDVDRVRILVDNWDGSSSETVYYQTLNRGILKGQYSIMLANFIEFYSGIGIGILARERTFIYRIENGFSNYVNTIENTVLPYGTVHLGINWILYGGAKY